MLTSLLFIVATPAPRNTPRMPMYGCVESCGIAAGGAFVGALSAPVAIEMGVRLLLSAANPNGRDHGESITQALNRWLIGVKNDLYRDALNDFGEVASRIVGRQKREAVAAGTGNVIYFASQHSAGKGVDPNRGSIAWMHVARLSLFVVREHPHLVLDERDNLCSRVNHLPWQHLSFADSAVLRRNDARVSQVGLCHDERRFFGVQIGLEHHFLRIKYSTLPLLRFEFGVLAA